MPQSKAHPPLGHTPTTPLGTGAALGRAAPPTVLEIAGEFLDCTSLLPDEEAGQIAGVGAVTMMRWRHAAPKRLDDAVLQRMLIHLGWYGHGSSDVARRVYGMERRGRIRYYGDFRDYAMEGGTLEPLIAPGEHVATAEHTVALELTVQRLQTLQEARKSNRRTEARATRRIP